MTIMISSLYKLTFPHRLIVVSLCKHYIMPWYTYPPYSKPPMLTHPDVVLLLLVFVVWISCCCCYPARVGSPFKKSADLCCIFKASAAVSTLLSTTSVIILRLQSKAKQSKEIITRHVPQATHVNSSTFCIMPQLGQPIASPRVNESDYQCWKWGFNDG